ncbi:hypothetical protein [Puia sp.]|uniref:hypothetical protein n=1 Tax=Puia sp. TaxID=2045100 RepID=UPI002F42958C
MQQPMQPILQHLFQASSLDDISRQQLEAFVEEYPSFGIGHYLLSRKLKAEDADRFATETQKTSLYFTNPFWLQWQLDHVVFASGGVGHHAVVEEPVAAVEEPVAVAEEPVAAAEEPVAVAEEPVAAAEEPVAFVEEPVAATDAPIDEAKTMTAGEGESIGGESSAADQLLHSIQEAKGLRLTLDKINTDFGTEPSIAGETLPAEAPIHDEEPPFVLDESAQVPPPTEPIHDEEPPFVLEEPEQPIAVSEPVVAEPVSAAEPVAPPQTQPEPASAPDLVFEPYHTIDYFASQGIKLTLDDNPSDQLGKQLKSFTEWLKGMRRLPRKDREVIPDRVAEEAIQSIAAHSIESKDILTETMAEVLVKQGMRERAKAVYEKLSLLNPGKRAYFAAKIEQLNIL